MPDRSGRMPGWNLVLRFLLELAALAGLAFAGWQLADGALSVVLAVVLPLAAAVAWGVFAVPGDPSRGGAAPVPVPGAVRLALELLVLGGGAVAVGVAGAPVLAAVLGALIVLHLAFSGGRLRWLLRQRGEVR
ncbi:MAG TPA: DUF2568 domain-containing protein [Micromonosporaceae bacterium]|nr:DUF2568 domain-containing protein [Micromonosporaceae bacterium]